MITLIYRNFILKNKYRSMVIRTNIYLMINNIIFIHNNFYKKYYLYEQKYLYYYLYCLKNSISMI